MKNVLIINGHQHYDGVAEGNVTTSVINKAKEFLNGIQHNVKETHIEKGYNVAEELEKFSWADYIIFQYPIYWMGVPWITKKYIDEVFSSGYGTVTYESDGRSREDATKRYGDGGLMKNKEYMLSLTYNCPVSEFDNKDGFFEGLTLDEANFYVHKIFQFCGLKPLTSFALHDIFKGDLNLDEELNNFQKILTHNFKG